MLEKAWTKFPPCARTRCIGASSLNGPRRPTVCNVPVSPARLPRPQRRDMAYFRQLRDISRAQMRTSPVMFPVAATIAVGSCCALAYGAYLHLKVRSEMAGFPEAVGLKLRRAIYFTDHKPDAAQALKAYLAAIQLAQEEEMHPLSAEVIGIYIELARFLEKTGRIKDAIGILEDQRKKALLWIDLHGHLEGNAADRTRLLQKAIQLATKIGELYSSPYDPDKHMSEEYLTWSVETMLKENERRRKEGLKPGEGDIGLDRDQQGAQLEALAHKFEEKDNFYFASQLFLQALTLKPTQDCHSVILMNNIAAAMAQMTPLVESGEPPPSRTQLRDSGRTWVKKALELSSSFKPPERTKECDVGCAVALHNLGEFAEMDGNLAEARERYEEAASIAHAVGFEEGVMGANEGLKRISAPPVKKKKGFWS